MGWAAMIIDWITPAPREPPSCWKVPRFPGQHETLWTRWHCGTCHDEGTAHWMLWHICEKDEAHKRAAPAPKEIT